MSAREDTLQGNKEQAINKAKRSKKKRPDRNQDYVEERASEVSGIPKETIKDAVNAFWNVIQSELEHGNAVKLHGKGRFYLSKRSSRIGRNPATGEEYVVPEREAMAWQTSPAYSKRLRKRRQEIKEAELKKIEKLSQNKEAQ